MSTYQNKANKLIRKFGWNKNTKDLIWPILFSITPLRICCSRPETQENHESTMDVICGRIKLLEFTIVHSSELACNVFVHK